MRAGMSNAEHWVGSAGNGTEPVTAPLEGRPRACGNPDLVLRIGTGRDARRSRLRSHFVSFGSSTRADVQLHDRAVSGLHFRARAERGLVCLEDLGSRNGLWVDGVRVRVADLGPGSMFVAGRTKLVVALASDSGAVSDAPAGPEAYVVHSEAMQDLMALAEHSFNKTAASRALGIPRSTLRDRLDKLQTEAGGDDDDAQATC